VNIQRAFKALGNTSMTLCRRDGQTDRYIFPIRYNREQPARAAYVAVVADFRRGPKGCEWLEKALKGIVGERECLWRCVSGPFVMESIA